MAFVCVRKLEEVTGHTHSVYCVLLLAMCDIWQ
jgi:hypothetical protein